MSLEAVGAAVTIDTGKSLTLLTAPWVFPVCADPIPDGALVVDAEGRLRDVGSRADLSRKWADSVGGRLNEQRHPSGALVPGFVNAHVHLELSSLRGRIPGGHGLPRWVGALMEMGKTESPAHSHSKDGGEAVPIAAAIAELTRTGTVAIGEVTNTLSAVPMLAESNLHGWIFLEALGSMGPTAAKVVSRCEQRVEL